MSSIFSQSSSISAIFSISSSISAIFSNQQYFIYFPSS
jgi:hypothetical protein